MTSLRTNRLRRIRSVSRVLKGISFAAVLGLAIAYVAAFVVSSGARAIAEAIAGDLGEATLTRGEVAVVFVIGLVPFGLFLAAVATAGQLFRAFQKGCILDPIAGTLLGRLGIFMLLSEIAGVLARVGASAYISAATGEGNAVLAISGTNIAGALFGLLVIVIGWVIAEAAEVALENQQIV